MKLSTPLVALAAGALLVLTGCAAPAAEPTPTATAENPYGGFPVDPPADDEVVLTLTGTSTVELTYAEVIDLATVELTIDEPFVNKTQDFTGIPFSDLFALAGIEPTDTVDTVALNDYHYPDSAQNFLDASAVLAVLRDGEPIPMDQGGPLRIIFADDSSYVDVLDAWNWSIRSIEILPG